MRMATNISWGDRLPDAVKAFRALATEYPSNLKAGVALARTLSWMGDNDGALTEIDKVLRQAPADREALLIKANALRGKNRITEAIAIYHQILTGGEDFEARSGLANALLATGDRKAAAVVAAPLPLQAEYPYQVREAKELAAELSAGAQPTLDAGFSYYNDTDSNYVRRYNFLYGQWLGNLKATLGFTHVDAMDPYRSDSAEIVSAGACRRLTDTIGAGAGLSLDLARSGETSGLLTWNARADKLITDGSLAASALSYLMTDTAQLIDNRIRATSYNLSASRKLGARFFLNGAYSYKDYSDNNGSNDVQGSLSCLLWSQAPRLTVGFKSRYLEFRRQSGGGYFDPARYIAPQLFASLSLEKGRFYTDIEPYVGYQFINRYSTETNEYFAGGSGTVGFKLFKNLAIEANGEGGNYALQSASTTGFTYYQAGARVVFTP
jgi:thioredoxin-like negative regulator of GroEL